MTNNDFLEYIADTGGWIGQRLEGVAADITIRLHGGENTLEVFQNDIERAAEQFHRSANRAADTLDEDARDPEHDGFGNYEEAYESLRELAYEEPDGTFPHDDRAEWEDARAELQDIFEDDRVEQP